MDIEGVSVFIFMKFQEHGYIRGYYPREYYCIHIRKIHEYIHWIYSYPRIHEDPYPPVGLG